MHSFSVLYGSASRSVLKYDTYHSFDAKDILHPTARLFRQPSPDDWDEVVRRVARNCEPRANLTHCNKTAQFLRKAHFKISRA